MKKIEFEPIDIEIIEFCEVDVLTNSYGNDDGDAQEITPGPDDEEDAWESL